MLLADVYLTLMNGVSSAGAFLQLEVRFSEEEKSTGFRMFQHIKCHYSCIKYMICFKRGKMINVRVFMPL